MRWIVLALSAILSVEVFATPSRFECKTQSGGGYRPYFLKTIVGNDALEDFSKKPKGLLGQNAMRSEDECLRAVAAANTEHGVICSRTGLDGYKPTLYTGTVPGRADFGYLGGSSINAFDDCLKVTENSSENGVCFWGGSDWWISPIDREGIKGGPFRSLATCVAQTAP